MNVIINFITKNKEIFIFILLILSVLILFKYNLKEGHTDYINSDSECEADYTNEILEVMTKYLDVNNKCWGKLIEINNKYVEFQDKMKVHGVTASHEKTCGDGEGVLPIDVAEKYMKDAGDLLIGDGGMYELFVEHSKLFDELKKYKLGRKYRTNVIVDSNEYDSNICDDATGYCQRAAWGNIEGSYDSNNTFVPRVTFDPNEKIGDPEEYNGDTSYIKTYVYQVCSVAEYIVGEIWKHCADSICIQMTTECDSRINNLTNKWTFDKTKICRNSINAKCPGAENAFMSYIGYPNPGLDTGIYLDPSISAPTLDCPQARTKVALRDCYWGKVSNENAYQKNGDNIHYTKESTRYYNLETEVKNMPGKIAWQEKENERLIAEAEAKLAAEETAAAEKTAATIENCNTYQIELNTMTQFAEVDGTEACQKWYDADGQCTYGSSKKKSKGVQTITCAKS
tara:strand:- start:417 stop:1781 length:1365 start_codon:yes stop_codon:yes gene_type:complete